MPSTYLTLPGFVKLQDELNFLRMVKRQEITALLRDTAGGDDFDGDANTEFDVVKQQQAFIEGRILELELLLSNPDIIDHHLHSNNVEIGSRVTISENEENLETYTIVGPVEASPVQGLISYMSPLGSALIGHLPGDDVVVRAPGGIYMVKILEVD